MTDYERPTSSSHFVGSSPRKSSIKALPSIYSPSNHRPTNNNVRPPSPNDRNIRFMQEEHQKVVENLYKEIDQLRGENKELKFNMVMRNCRAPEEKSQSPSMTSLQREIERLTVEVETLRNRQEGHRPRGCKHDDYEEFIAGLQSTIEEQNELIASLQSQISILKNQKDTGSAESPTSERSDLKGSTKTMASKVRGYKLPGGAITRATLADMVSQSQSNGDLGFKAALESNPINGLSPKKKPGHYLSTSCVDDLHDEQNVGNQSISPIKKRDTRFMSTSVPETTTSLSNTNNNNSLLSSKRSQNPYHSKYQPLHATIKSDMSHTDTSLMAGTIVGVSTADDDNNVFLVGNSDVGGPSSSRKVPSKKDVRAVGNSVSLPPISASRSPLKSSKQ